MDAAVDSLECENEKGGRERERKGETGHGTKKERERKSVKEVRKDAKNNRNAWNQQAKWISC